MPDQLNKKQVQDFVFYLRDEKGVAKGTFSILLAGLEVPQRGDVELRLAADHEKKVREPRQKRLPGARSDTDCRSLIAAVHHPVYRGCIAMMYACGLRLSEAAQLPVSAVDSKRMLLLVVGKRNKPWALPLAEPVLDMLLFTRIRIRRRKSLRRGRGPRV